MKLLFLTMFIAIAGPLLVQAQDHTSEVRSLRSKVSALESKINNLESEMRSVKTKLNDAGIVLFFFAVFCAWWAQHTNRNPWLWFFLGLLFNIITALVLLSKNAADKQNKIRGWRTI